MYQGVWREGEPWKGLEEARKERTASGTWKWSQKFESGFEQVTWGNICKHLFIAEDVGNVGSCPQIKTLFSFVSFDFLAYVEKVTDAPICELSRPIGAKMDMLDLISKNSSSYERTIQQEKPSWYDHMHFACTRHENRKFFDRKRFTSLANLFYINSN